MSGMDPRLGALVLAAAAAAGFAGCAQPPSAASNLRLTADEQGERRVLGEAEQREALAALRSIAEGRKPQDPPSPARRGLRWSDLPLAVHYASEEVEMAVVRMREISDDEVLFQLRTVDERPVELRLRRLDDKRVYEAEARVGLFESDDARAARLVEALRQNMNALGRKRALD